MIEPRSGSGVTGIVAGLAILACILLLLGMCTPAHAHDHWINRGHYRSSAGVHCCNATGAAPDCVEIDPSTIRYTPGGFETEHGFIDDRSVHPSEDGRSWLCRSPGGKPRCLFIVRGF